MPTNGWITSTTIMADTTIIIVMDIDITRMASTNANSGGYMSSGITNDDTVANSIPIIAASSDHGAGKVDRRHCIHQVGCAKSTRLTPSRGGWFCD